MRLVILDFVLCLLILELYYGVSLFCFVVCVALLTRFFGAIIVGDISRIFTFNFVISYSVFCLLEFELKYGASLLRFSMRSFGLHMFRLEDYFLPFSHIVMSSSTFRIYHMHIDI